MNIGVLQTENKTIKMLNYTRQTTKYDNSKTEERKISGEKRTTQ
jgi:hypothetical protein